MKQRPKTKPRRNKPESFADLDKAARDTSDVRPLSPEMRRRWEAAKRTGPATKRGRPPKDPALKSRIVPVSLVPALLAEADRFADAAGISRSRLIAEALRLRMSQ